MGAGPGVPETSVTLDESSAVCTDNLREVAIGHAVQLAPFCESTDFLFFESLFIECGRGNQFFKPQVGDVFIYSCAETANFETNSSPSDPKSLPATSIMTDRQWRDDFFLDCFTAQRLRDNVGDNAPTLSPRSEAAIMPVNTGVAPSVMVVTTPSAIAPVSSPISSPGEESPAGQEDKSALGLVIGVSVGAVVFLAIAGVVLFALLWMKPAQRKEVKEVREFAAGNDDAETGQTHSAAHPEGPTYANDAVLFSPPTAAVATVIPMPASQSPPTTDGAKSHDGTHQFENPHQHSPPQTSGNHDVDFKDQARTFIYPWSTPNRASRPDSIGVPNAHDDTASAITEAETRGSVDPSGIYSHETSKIDPEYGNDAAGSSSKGGSADSW